MSADLEDLRCWLVLAVHAPRRGEELLLIDALRRVGARVVQREGDCYVAYVPNGGDPEALVHEAEYAVRASTSMGSPKIRWRKAAPGEVETLWKQDVGPQRITDRISVVPGDADPVQLGRDAVSIRLAAGVGFGTAEHATTRACLRMLERRVVPGTRLADVGSGSGILAIAAALLGARSVLALETDPLAVETARRNVALNGVEERVVLEQIHAGPGDLPRLGRFDGIVANIEVSVLLDLLPGLQLALVPGGWLIVSGVTGDEPRQLVREARAAAFALRDVEQEAGWWTGEFSTRAAP